MKLIKLDAIDSTNDFLKGLSNTNTVENFTVVTAESQTNGKGQMGSKWESEKGKNLIVSVLIKNQLININQIFDLNVAVALSIFESLNHFEIPELSIKWPNDIMSANKKIAGILIENTLKSNDGIQSIIGFGINVNQTNFDGLPNASSLKNCLNVDFDKEILLTKIIDTLKTNLLNSNNTAQNWNVYNDNLYKKSVLMPFENQLGGKFMGIIQQVNTNGKVQILIENDVLKEFEIKEIKMLF
jgi:BirA family transcriptional regulator, biotin operon repressor / biotin---[acetyl-CoA-carboxylase] ligase